MEKRLTMVEEQVASVDKQIQELKEKQASSAKAKHEPIENKFPQYVKDGKVNTKQVLDMLQVQEKEQEKVGAVCRCNVQVQENEQTTL